MPISAGDRYSLMLRALYYLYIKSYSQTDIAKMLNISRVTLSKLLDEARAEGMLKIEIVDVRNELRLVDMEEEMKQRFGLRDVKLVDGTGIDEEELKRKIASRSAAYFTQLIHSGMKIGVTWGRTLNAMLDYLPVNHSIKDLVIYTLLGNTSSSPAFQPTVLAQSLLQKYNGTLKTLTAPFMCHSPQLCADIKNDPQIAAILDEASALDLSMVGIGEAPVKGSSKLSDYPFDAEMIKELVESGAVGDICGNFFDINGRLCDTHLKERIVSIDITDLRSQKMVVGIGGGARKISSIVGALNGSYLDVLITDMQTASAALELSRSL